MTSAIDPAGDMNRMFTSVTVGDHVVTLREIDGYGPAP